MNHRKSSSRKDRGIPPRRRSKHRTSSERKRTKKSDNHYRIIFHNAGDAIFIHDMGGHFREVNRIACERLGYSRKELLRMTPTDIDHPRSPELVTKRVDEVRRLGHVIVETAHVRRDGTIFPVELSSRIIEYKGKPAVLSIARDITERKHAEEASSRLAAIVESSDDAVIGKTLDGVITSWNHGAERQYGYSAEEVKGKSISILIPPSRPDELKQILERVRRGERIQHYETERMRKDGKIVNVSLGMSPIRDATGRIVGASTIARDITRRKQAEEALRVSEMKYRTLFKNIPHGIYQTSPEGKLLTANPALVRVLGYDSETELLATDIDRDLYANPEDRKKWMRQLETHGEVRDAELVLKRKDGRELIVLDNAHLFRDEQGAIRYYEGTLTDITERKKMEEDLRRYSERLEDLVAERTAKLQESEERFRGIAERSFDTIFTTDLEGQITYVSSAVKNIFGYSPVEVVGKRIQGYLTEDEIPKLRQAFAALRTGKSIGGLEAQAYGKDGPIAHVEINASPMVKDGNVVGMQGIARDVTERKRAEIELRAAGERLRYVITSNPAAIFTGKPRADLSDYEVTYMSNRVVEMLGFEPGQFIGHPGFWEAHVHPDDLHRYPTEVPMLWKKGQCTFEYRFLHKDGTYRWIREEAKVVRDADGKPTEVMGYWTDVTERKQMEEKLVKAERLSAIGETVMMVGHDLRNPLQVMVNSLALWEEISNSMPPEYRQLSDKLGVKRLLERIDRQLEYMNKIISDLQDYARPVKPELTNVDVLNFTKEALSTITVPENIVVSVKSGNAAHRAMLDPAMMKRVLTNLITNAIQAMPNGGALTIAVSTAEGSASIDVADTGVGIPEEHLTKIFQPLFSTKSKGQGLGLPVCKRLVEAHDGSIIVKSKVGEGTTFTVNLPLK